MKRLLALSALALLLIGQTGCFNWFRNGGSPSASCAPACGPAAGGQFQSQFGGDPYMVSPSIAPGPEVYMPSP